MNVDLPNAMKPASNNKEQQGLYREYALKIEQYFEAHAIISRVVEVNTETYGIQCCIDVAVGTPIANVVKHEKGLGVFLGAPNKRVTIEAPVAGRSVIGITIPWINPYPKIPMLEHPNPQAEYIELLGKSIDYYKKFEKLHGVDQIIGSLTLNLDNQAPSITRDYLFLKDVFDKEEENPNILRYTRLIEITYESFGLLVEVIEIDMNPDNILFYVKPKAEMQANDIVKHSIDLCLALALPGGSIGVTAPLPGKDQFGVYVPRINFSRNPIRVEKTPPQSSAKGLFGAFRSKRFLNKSREYFRKFEVKFKINNLYLVTKRYQDSFRKLDNTRLIDTFNIKNSGSESQHERASRLVAMQREFERRNIDYSAIMTFADGVSQENKIKIVGKTIFVV